MATLPNYLPGTPPPAACLPLAALAAAQAAAACPAGTPWPLNASALPYQHSLGVCHQVSQLLLLRHRGFHVSLSQVHPVLRRCLRLLQLTHLTPEAV